MLLSAGASRGCVAPRLTGSRTCRGRQRTSSRAAAGYRPASILPAVRPAAQPRSSRRCVVVSAAAHGGGDEELDPTELDGNRLQTAMVLALRGEDYATAARIRDEMLAREMSEGKGGKDGSWEGLGAPGWLGERLRQLDFVMPLEIQKRAMRKVLDEGKDALIVSQTGSGKTLSFLVPLLCSLDYSYFQDYYFNQIMELEELEEESGASNDPEPAAAAATTAAAGTAPAADDVSGGDGGAGEAAKAPPVQAVVVVPTFELGAQICLTLFKLLGGNISSRRKDEPGDPYNMFSYTGPKGVDVTGMFTNRDVLASSTFGKLDGTQVLVGTPQHLAACVREKGLDMEKVKFLAVDEFDACWAEFPEDMELLLAPQETPRRTILCGATISDEVAAAIHEKRWVEEAGDLRVADACRVPAGTRHRYVIAADEEHKLVAVTRLLRKDLKELGPDSPPARVMVYAQSEETARRASPALRRSLWGEHKMTTLLPEGREPLLALESFRDNRTTLMLATPYHCRGLDLPAVSHVYNLEVPSSAAAYVHQAGRTGRVGWAGEGRVVTVVTPAEVGALLALGEEVNVELEEEAFPTVDFGPLLNWESQGDIPETEVAANFLPEETIKNLEDVYNLFGLESSDKASSADDE